jgi:hypothetical protein
MAFDGMSVLGIYNFMDFWPRGVMDFMESVPTEQSFHPILSLRTGNFMQINLFGLLFSSN